MLPGFNPLGIAGQVRQVLSGSTSDNDSKKADCKCGYRKALLDLRDRVSDKAEGCNNALGPAALAYDNVASMIDAIIERMEP